MIYRPKQPNECNVFCDPDEPGQEISEAYAHACTDDFKLQSLLAGADASGNGAGQWVTPQGQRSPQDFSAEDLFLARDLNGLFSVEREELLPLFVQTLAGDCHDWQAPSGLTQRVTYHVFRRLHLPLHQANRPIFWITANHSAMVPHQIRWKRWQPHCRSYIWERHVSTYLSYPTRQGRKQQGRCRRQYSVKWLRWSLRVLHRRRTLLSVSRLDSH